MRFVALALALVLCASHARADVPPPWAAGVTEQQKARAHELLDAGNALFLDKKYAEALVKYRAAVEAWDHPAIRFNIVRCLIQLDRSVEAAENLKTALRYGAAPLEEAVYGEALAYEKLLAKQVGDLTIACEQTDVEITLDGQVIAKCPARVTRRMAPGKHHLIATKGGYLPQTQEVVVIGGETQEVVVRLFEIGAVRNGGPRFYGKVTLVGGAGLLAVAGGFALWGYHRYHAQFPEHCGGGRPEIDGKPGCDPTGFDAVERARVYGGVATVVSVIGAAAVVTGAIVIWRSPRTERRAVLTPTKGGAGVVLSGTF